MRQVLFPFIRQKLRRKNKAWEKTRSSVLKIRSLSLMFYQQNLCDGGTGISDEKKRKLNPYGMGRRGDGEGGER